MKTGKTVFYFLIAAALIFSLCTCFSPWTGDEGGNLSLVWANAGAGRWVSNPRDLEALSYDVTLKGPGGTIQQSFAQGTPGATFKVIPGIWTVTIKGRGSIPAPFGGTTSGFTEAFVMGIQQIEVKAGQDSTETIGMYNASEVSSWAELDAAIGMSRNREEIILLKNSFDFYQTSVTIDVFRPVTLIAETDVVIGRGEPNAFGWPEFFEVYDDGVLTLGNPGMGGTISIDNYNMDSHPLLNISYSFYGGTLIMNEGVTIKNGLFMESSGSVCVNNRGTFIMNGGAITGNSSPVYGGGVLVNSGGHFIHNGGTISGNTPDDVVFGEP